ncbi:pilus assembly protein TadG-related protein [Gymnodinialimonas hymeniacidonis]|uniref:pilus assembly protein TadG-related protein n=1 Tax=Gymnodinialimonas hymeniacidonis TaxID=3126508 RepID=UPI0034C5B2EB
MMGLVSKMATSANAWAARLSPVRFAKKEEGTVTAFAVLMFILMVGASGIAIDVMRYETQRTQLQYTLDRAILAAASLTQPYDPEGVVRNYFEISGIEDYRLDVRVDEGLNFRRVHAYAELEVRSMFMSLFGVRVMTSPAIGAAEERVRNIEVSMVLDISGSMGSNNRMTNMRPAARDFVTEVLTANETLNADNLVSVSIVPYNGRVNGGDMIDSVFTFDDLHTASNCARFTPVDSSYSFDPSNGWASWSAASWGASDFLTTAIDPTVPIQRLGHWDRGNEGANQALMGTPHCQTDQYGAILPWQHDETILHNHINSLGTGGWTAIDLGVNWAVALLDPTANPAVNGLIASGQVHSDFDDRPAPFVDNDPSTTLDDETIKVVVMMTDGANTNQYDLRDVWEHNGTFYFDNAPNIAAARYIGFRTGYAPIFRHAGADGVLSTGYFEDNRWRFGDDRFSIWWEDQGTDGRFWIPSGDPRTNGGGTWSDTPFGGWAAYGLAQADGVTVVPEWQAHRANAYDPTANRDADGNGNADGALMTWSALFGQITADSIAHEWFWQPANASGQWDFFNLVDDNASYLYAGRNEADRNLRAICDAANAAGIIVYAIAFEAPSGGQSVMRYCATTDATYYNVEGLEISEAFENIARSINQLRLIQ